MKRRRLTSHDRPIIGDFASSYAMDAGADKAKELLETAAAGVPYGVFDDNGKLVGMFAVSKENTSNVLSKAGEVPDIALNVPPYSPKKKQPKQPKPASAPQKTTEKAPQQAAPSEEAFDRTTSPRGWAAVAEEPMKDPLDDDLDEFMLETAQGLFSRVDENAKPARNTQPIPYQSYNPQPASYADPFAAEFYSSNDGGAFDFSNTGNVAPVVPMEPEPVDEQAEKGKFIGKMIAIIIMLAVITGVVVGAYFLITGLSKNLTNSNESSALNYSMYTQADVTALAHVHVAPGDTLEDVKLKLCEQGMVSAARGIDDAVHDPENNLNGSIQSADYIVLGSESSEDVLRRMAEGDRVPDGVMGVNEGDTLEVIAENIDAAHLPFTGAEFLGYCRNWHAWKEPYPFLSGIPDEVPSIEGYIFTGEYNLSQCPDPGEAMHVFLRESQKHYEASGLNPHDWFIVLTKASMIEKEALFDEDRPLIASVINNRVAENEFLQIDATVKYATGSNEARVTYNQTEVASPYNTYTVRGLPIGPICSGISQPSIDAAMHPAETNFFYYVLSDEEGHHTFSETPEQFEADKRHFMELFGYDPADW